jgi:glutamate 5-kinase
VLLSDVEGLYDRSPGTPGARVIAEVRDHRLLDRLEGPARRGWGSGGIRSKVLAAEMASAGGIPSVIAHGGRPGVLSAAVAGEPVGTRLHASRSPLPAFKLWLRYGKPVRGRLTVDAGARRAVEEQGTSLLPVGLTAVDGRFDAGDAVELVEQGGPPFAMGLAGQAAGDLRRLAGARGAGEAVHRDNLVLLWR